TTFAIPVIEAAQRQGEIYLVRFVDEQRGYAVSVGICVHHQKLVRRIFEQPKIGIHMQLQLPFTQPDKPPYPPIVVSRVIGNSMKYWEYLIEQRKNDEDELYGVDKEINELKPPNSSFYGQITNNPVKEEEEEDFNINTEKYPRNPLLFMCVPIVRRPVRIWRQGDGFWDQIWKQKKNEQLKIKQEKEQKEKIQKEKQEYEKIMAAELNQSKSKKKSKKQQLKEEQERVQKEQQQKEEEERLRIEKQKKERDEIQNNAMLRAMN
ncbi:MAG: hypothetical protein EZS28_047762, partial [Streblomastix strix]